MDYDESKDRLLFLDYFSVVDYLFLLIEISAILNKDSILFLAAAVSDFYLPDTSVSEHKIQSSRTSLNLNLKPVPKMIGLLRKHCCPESFIVSFKLETEEALVVRKGQESLIKYGHDLVVSNCLATRKHQVILIDSSTQEIIESRTGFIEELLVKTVIFKYNENKIK